MQFLSPGSACLATCVLHFQIEAAAVILAFVLGVKKVNGEPERVPQQLDGLDNAFPDGVTDIIVEVGIGEKSSFLKWVEAKGDRGLVMFEPSPRSVPALGHAGSARVKFIAAAVGTQERATLYLADSPECDSTLLVADEYLGDGCIGDARGRGISVRMLPLAKTITSLQATAVVVLLKVDAQGADLDVLISAGDSLSRVRRVLVEAMDLPRSSTALPYVGMPVKDDFLHVAAIVSGWNL